MMLGQEERENNKKDTYVEDLEDKKVDEKEKGNLEEKVEKKIVKISDVFGVSVASAATGAYIGWFFGPTGTIVGSVVGAVSGIYLGYKSSYDLNKQT